jgi:predicted metal-dependent hydrolase
MQVSPPEVETTFRVRTGITPPPSVQIGQESIPINFRRNPKARRYILRFKEARLIATIPRGGSQHEAFAFIQRSQSWIERQLAKKSEPSSNDIWFRGQKVPLAQFGTPHVARYLRAIAIIELTPRVRELAAKTNSEITRVCIRNQRTRWGSCSTRRAINLNWRLIQTPPHVVDYIILHELMHLRQMNHSEKFWREVESVCPTWRESELWLKHHGREIMTA